jgi:hypothetical protein
MSTLTGTIQRPIGPPCRGFTVGLLFVGVSLNVALIADSPEHCARARETPGQLLVLVILGVVNSIARRRHRLRASTAAEMAA